eukprot:CAMPEP_0198728578 /NCGR_PEP_ID=MMETSP1475-20131203/10066_1 /TAXON_ID= ORGANISM="Unidentified sp., Strain CCMP1999" /NCGR_SAMPLE_ID=MMETSP1475 /ASSEMBLY_ACC=CAM_ASM_001111 /LENGTH=217 /DNA_ID=CAMNT_0044490979 /DNA_START=79 /DNA_END=732 /DNA_ORIENTATION=+
MAELREKFPAGRIRQSTPKELADKLNTQKHLSRRKLSERIEPKPQDYGLKVLETAAQMEVNTPMRVIAREIYRGRDPDSKLIGFDELKQACLADRMFRSKRHFRRCLDDMRYRDFVEVKQLIPPGDNISEAMRNRYFKLQLTKRGETRLHYIKEQLDGTFDPTIRAAALQKFEAVKMRIREEQQVKAPDEVTEEPTRLDRLRSRVMGLFKRSDEKRA